MKFVTPSGRFKGEFWENPESISVSQKELKRSHSPEQNEYLRKKIEEDSKKYPFEMKVFDFNEETGLFLARCEDHFGPSAIMGLEQDEDIKFQKVYRQARAYSRVPSFLDDFSNLKIFEYCGIIDSRTAEAHGTYGGRTLGGNGFWDMKPVK